MKTLKDAKDQIAFLFTNDITYDARDLVPAKEDPGRTVEVLAKATVHLRYLEPFISERIEGALNAVAQEVGWKQGDVNKPVRIAITGRTIGPPLYDSLEVLGRDQSLERIEAAIDALGKANS
jgi:glutamyl-tRNA synthetase